MKKITLLSIITIIVIAVLAEIILAFTTGKGIFTETRGQKYEYTDEYMALMSVNVDLFSHGEITLENKRISSVSKYKINNNKYFNVYTCNPNNSIIVITLSSCNNCIEDSILGVALKKDSINTYSDIEKHEITYPVLRIREGYGVHITVKSKSLVLPGDIYKDGKVISTYTKEERGKIVKFLKKEATR